MDLQRLVGDESEDLAAGDLDGGALKGELLDGARVAGLDRVDHLASGADLVHLAGGAVERALDGVEARGHLAELVLDQAERRDGFPELLALAGVFDGGAQHVLGRAHGAGAEREAAEVENVEGDIGAFADLAEHVLDGHRRVLEDKAAGGGGLDAKLELLPAGGDTGEGFLDDEGGDVLAVHLGENNEDISPRGIGDPHLGAVENVMGLVGGEHGLGLHAEGVGAGAGLTEAVGGHELAGGEPRQVFFLLRLVAEIRDRARADAAVRAAGDAEAREPAELLGDAERRDLAEAETVVSLGHLEAEQAELRGLTEEFRREALLMVLERLEAREHFLVHELLGGGGHFALVAGEILGGEDELGLGLGEQKVATGEMGGQIFLVGHGGDGVAGCS